LIAGDRRGAALGYVVEDRAWRGAHLFGVRVPPAWTSPRCTAALERPRRVRVAARQRAARRTPRLQRRGRRGCAPGRAPRRLPQKLGLLIEASTHARIQARTAEDGEARILAAIEHMSRRMELMEERLDFTERLVGPARERTRFPRRQADAQLL
jgi:hypothetical protein